MNSTQDSGNEVCRCQVSYAARAEGMRLRVVNRPSRTSTARDSFALTRSIVQLTSKLHGFQAKAPLGAGVMHFPLERLAASRLRPWQYVVDEDPDGDVILRSMACDTRAEVERSNRNRRRTINTDAPATQLQDALCDLNCGKVGLPRRRNR